MDNRPVANETALERLIEDMPQKPFLTGNEGVSMCLAGAQPKIGVYLDDNGKISIPINGTLSTWILKPDAANLPDVVYNEALCMRLAALAGLDAPEVRIGRAGARKYLLIRRYDRRLQGNQWYPPAPGRYVSGPRVFAGNKIPIQRYRTTRPDHSRHDWRDA